MLLAGVTFFSRDDIGGLLAILVVVIDCYAIYGAPGVRTFAVVS